jgi:ribose transport system substrate-binding protein
VASALVAAGCGNDDDEATAGASPGGVAADVQQRVEGAKQPITEWTGPADAPKPAEDKRIVVVTCSSQGIGCVRAARGVTEAGRALGWEVETIDGKGDPAVWNRAIQLAITTKADGIVLDAVPPQLVGDALENARAAEIPIVSVFNPKPTQQSPVFAYVRPEHTEQGRLMADWLAVDSGGDARVVLVEDNEFPELVERVQGFRTQLARSCSDCEIVSTVQSQIGTMAQRLPQAVVSALQRNPEANYIVSQYDSNAFFAGEGVRQAGKAGQVKVAGYEGDPQTLPAIKEGQQAATIADPAEWMGWQAIDEFVRALAGERAENTPVAWRLLTKDNVPSTNGWLGDFDFRSKYRELWGL